MRHHALRSAHIAKHMLPKHDVEYLNNQVTEGEYDKSRCLYDVDYILPVLKLLFLPFTLLNLLQFLILCLLRLLELVVGCAAALIKC